MTIEEKAKAYDEVLERGRKLKKTCDSTAVIGWCEYLVPGLKESEDEKIRKEIIDYIKIGTYKKDWIAWLEKQGTSYTKRDIDDTYVEGIAFAKDELKKQYEASYQTRKDIATFIFNYRGDIKDRAKWIDYLGFKVSFVEKQDEQNKIEALRTEYEKGRADAIAEMQKSDKKIIPIFRVGDVLKHKNGDTVIVSQVDTQHQCYCYKAWNGAATIHCDFSFEEQDEWELVEQKPVWSEEDSRKIGTLSSIIYDYAFLKDALDENHDLTGEYAELDNWLGFLPERFNLHPKQEWSEEAIEEFKNNLI